MPELYFLGDLIAKCHGNKSAAQRILRLGGKPVFGAKAISDEDLLKEYQKASRIKPIHDVQDTPLGQSGGAGDGEGGRSLEEAFGLGSHTKRSRRRSKKQALRVVSGGGNLDSQEVC